MHESLETFLTLVPERQPKTFKAIYPKRITPPGGYLNPKYFSITLWSELEVGFSAEMNRLPHVTGLINALLHLEYGVPTYFVRSEFAQAVAQTEPPADFKFSEIRWPMPAMLFVLPTDFVLKQFGFMCPFISVTHSPAGEYPKRLKKLPQCEMPIHAVHPVQSTIDRFNVIYPVYSQNEAPVDYTGSYPMTMNVNEMGTAPFDDATYMEEASLDPGRFYLNRTDVELPPEGELEHPFNMKVQNFAVKLMLLLTARPNFIAHGAQSRPAKIKHGRVRDAIWNPNLIGWDYRAQRPVPEVPTEETGKEAIMGCQPHSHASPRMHWRRGHMRNQPFGPKPWTDTTTKRLTWIEPVLINAPEEAPE